MGPSSQLRQHFEIERAFRRDRTGAGQRPERRRDKIQVVGANALRRDTHGRGEGLDDGGSGPLGSAGK